jgi:hypothetical protein
LRREAIVDVVVTALEKTCPVTEHARMSARSNVVTVRAIGHGSMGSIGGIHGYEGRRIAIPDGKRMNVEESMHIHRTRGR